MLNYMTDIPREEFVYKCTSACAGCSSSLCLRYVLKAAGPDTVLVVPHAVPASFRVPTRTPP